jgi:hypothetical protein
VRGELATINPRTDADRNLDLLLRLGELERGRRELLEAEHTP